ncbi:MAG: DUF3467 domain-containing protein [Chloroflexi bacterium]|nr:DUF3467 domain-containing protein [Chloroflexota bacterium]
MALPPPARPASPALEIKPEQPVIYANLVRISHSPADIVLDFAHLLPGETRASVGARILMSPLSAKLLYKALGENLARYEAAFGEINLPGNSSLAEHLFRPFNNPENPPEKK